MGIVTGRNEGAIHSSKSRGGVVTSKFKGRTIPNGGWNRVGLLEAFEYEGIGTDGTSGTVLLVPHSCNEKNRPLVPPSLGSGADVEDFYGGEVKAMKVIVQAENGGAVKLRQSKDPKKKEYAFWEEYPSGTKAEVLKAGDTWSKIQIGNRVGFMMTKFLVVDDSGIPAEQDQTESKELRVESGDQVALLSEVYHILKDLCERIEETIGEG